MTTAITHTIKATAIRARFAALHEQRKWVAEHGATLDGYVKKYGSKHAADHYGDGGEAIYAADLAELHKLERAAFIGLEFLTSTGKEATVLAVVPGDVASVRVKLGARRYKKMPITLSEIEKLAGIADTSTPPDSRDAFKRIENAIFDGGGRALAIAGKLDRRGVGFEAHFYSVNGRPLIIQNTGSGCEVYAPLTSDMTIDGTIAAIERYRNADEVTGN